MPDDLTGIALKRLVHAAGGAPPSENKLVVGHRILQDRRLLRLRRPPLALHFGDTLCVSACGRIAAALSACEGAVYRSKASQIPMFFFQRLLLGSAVRHAESSELFDLCPLNWLGMKVSVLHARGHAMGHGLTPCLH